LPEATLNGTAADPEAECTRYETLLQALGRPALSLLGLGTNGHIALNEPAPQLPSKTAVIPLDQPTISRARKEMGSHDIAPYGLTLPLPRIMSASKILLLASGPHKKTAVNNMLTGPITTQCPASLLHLHPDTLVLLDSAAAPQQGENNG
jgi:glucosamine-6-phosphate deaminase